jgi:NAD(P)H-hydrate repair Nnr-like enzyme with NAD(P)H-hydrate dehydratase domain
MLRGVDGADQWRDLLADQRFSGVVIGPGFGVDKATRAVVAALLGAVEKGRRFGLVLDADALTSFSGESVRLGSFIERSGADVVLTPHEGEFSRLFSEKDGKLSVNAEDEAASGSAGSAPVGQGPDPSSKVSRARAAAAALGATIVLKGPDTIVASPDGRAAIARNAPPTLATAGSGDVLAGLIGGLLAQAMPAFEAAACAVWLHGEAANLFGPGLIAEDLPEILPRVLADLAPL